MNAKQRICLGFLFACMLLHYLYSDFSLSYTSYRKAVEVVKYFVNTPGCHMLALNPFSMEVLLEMKPVKPIGCSQPELLQGESIRGRKYLSLAMTEEQILIRYGVDNMTDIDCFYTVFERHNDTANLDLYSKRFQLSKQFKKVPLGRNVNMLRIKCQRGNETIYHDVNFYLPDPPRPPLPSKYFRPNRLSVMVLGIDSLSHMHYLRSMPQTKRFVEQQPHVEFFGYNRVGRNSYINLIPLLSGLSEKQLEAECVKGRGNYDSCELIWKKFKAAGYSTSFGEDTSFGGTFVCGKKGFKRQPTDFYLRPVLFEMYTRTKYSDLSSIYCSGRRTFADVLFEFIHKLVPHMQHSLHFSFFWSTQGVHDYIDYAQLADADYAKLLRHLRSRGILENTLILLMSDHGMRFGSFRDTYQGMVEESQPLLIAIYPRWLNYAYPLAISNLKSNAHSLVTTYDLHATLLDLLELKELDNNPVARRTVELTRLGSQLPRGISLFLPIPQIRDCKLAGIPAHFCLCYQLQEMSTSSSRAQRAARFIVRNINSQLKHHRQCQPLKLEAVKAAYLLNRQVENSKYEMKVRVLTSPGGGLFEGTTKFAGNGLALDGVVTRANKYGNQSYCIDDYRIEMYCYCL